jgi:hypothetical protein
MPKSLIIILKSFNILTSYCINCHFKTVKQLNWKVCKNEVYTIGAAKINCTQEVLLESKVGLCSHLSKYGTKKLCLKNLIAFLKTLDSFHYLSLESYNQCWQKKKLAFTTSQLTFLDLNSPHNKLEFAKETPPKKLNCIPANVFETQCNIPYILASLPCRWKTTSLWLVFI